ncbi:hypothetical protein BaRGS_00025187 [Batillaria attramentaria]|uniref:Uncharacterized protein n=1 Tax=Batillaria attramentaria TaxID=370345 RepID=A0ABD0K8X8_9CAEN
MRVLEVGGKEESWEWQKKKMKGDDITVGILPGSLASVNQHLAMSTLQNCKHSIAKLDPTPPKENHFRQMSTKRRALTKSLHSLQALGKQGKDSLRRVQFSDKRSVFHKLCVTLTKDSLISDSCRTASEPPTTPSCCLHRQGKPELNITPGTSLFENYGIQTRAQKGEDVCKRRVRSS